MDSSVRVDLPTDWGKARRSLCPTDWEHFSRHPDLAVRLGLLENPSVEVRCADAIAKRELAKASGVALDFVRREVARSRRVSDALLHLVAECGEWEVWAVLLHNPSTPPTVLQMIAGFVGNNEAEQKAFAYLVARARERLSEKKS